MLITTKELLASRSKMKGLKAISLNKSNGSIILYSPNIIFLQKKYLLPARAATNYNRK